MKTLIRLLLTLLALAVVVIIIAIIAVPTYLDPNDLKPTIEAQAREHGQEIKIDGDMKLSVFPWITVEMGETTLGNAAGFSEPYFAKMERVEVSIKLLPLLRKEVEMDTVVLHGLTVNIEKNHAGAANYEALMAQSQQRSDDKDDADDDDEQRKLELASLAIGGVDIQNATINWRDDKSGQRATIKNLTIETGAIAPGSETSLHMGMDFDARGAKQASGRLDLDGTVKSSADGKRIEIAGLEFKTVASGAAVPVENFDLAIKGDVVTDLDAQTMSIPQLTLETLGMVLSGALGAEQILDAPRYNASLDVAEFSPRDLLERLGQPPVQTADANVLSKMKLSARFKGTNQSVTLEGLDATLDDTRLQGEFAVLDYSGPSLRFALDVDSIDLDRYLPPPAEPGAAPAAATPATGAAAAGQQAPLAALRTLRADGSVNVGKVKVAKLSATDISMKLKARDGVIGVDPLDAQLYEGSYTSNMALDVRGDQPVVTIKESLSGVQAGPLLKDLTGKEQLLGQGRFNADMKFTGLDPEAAKKTLNGNADFAFNDGAIKGVNVAALIRKAKAALGGGNFNDSGVEQKTDFSELSGSLNVSNGLVQNQDLSLKSPLLRISGKGNANLVSEQIDYLLSTKIVGSLQGSGGADLKELKGVEVPVRVSGTFSEPKYAPEVGKVLEAAAKKEVKKQVKKQVEKALGDKLKDGVGGKAGDLLKGLFN